MFPQKGNNKRRINILFFKIWDLEFQVSEGKTLIIKVENNGAPVEATTIIFLVDNSLKFSV